MTGKIFCIGLQKTGTSSLARALHLLGYSVGNSVRRVNSEVDWRVEDPKADILEKTIEMAEECDALQDSPCPFVFRELDDAFPHSKFILTHRDTDDWLDSYRRYFPDRNNQLRRWMYGVDQLSGNEKTYRAVYEAKNAEIIEYFSNRPDDLLVMNLEKGDGWLELVSFLGADFIKPFPHMNKGVS